jgi:hypothetical protein
LAENGVFKSWDAPFGRDVPSRPLPMLPQPNFVPQLFSPDQRINLFRFGAIEQELLWQFLFTDPAPTMTPRVNHRVA